MYCVSICAFLPLAQTEVRNRTIVSHLGLNMVESRFSAVIESKFFGKLKVCIVSDATHSFHLCDKGKPKPSREFIQRGKIIYTT